jgi:hypothetical protein
MNAITIHWHAGHNVAGYLPESDVYTCASWREALDALVADLERAWDDADTMLDGDARYLEAHTAMHGATEGQDFLTYPRPTQTPSMTSPPRGGSARAPRTSAWPTKG